MKILALVASQDSTVEDVKTNGRRQMQALSFPHTAGLLMVWKEQKIMSAVKARITNP